MCDLPNIDGLWEIKGYYLQYDTPESSVDLCEPRIFPKSEIVIKQKGRFFTYERKGDTRLPKLGVLEKVYLNGSFYGWKGHLVDTKFDNENFIFNFSKICGNIVKKFDITYTESGFSNSNPSQVPRVEYAKARRLK